MSELNQSFESIFVDVLLTELGPINRLVSYLCLRYHVQAAIQPSWTDKDPKGFFDLLRNIKIVTDENDLEGLVSMEFRARLPWSDEEMLRKPYWSLVSDIPFEQLGTIWLVESLHLNLQREQIEQHDIKNEDTKEIDFNDPFLKSFTEIGFYPRPEPLFYDTEFITDKHISVDILIQNFLQNKPGAKRSPLKEFLIKGAGRQIK